MARPAIEIVAEAKKKLDKEFPSCSTGPYFWADYASATCNPNRYPGNNKSEWIKIVAKAAAGLLKEIETIQAIKGDGIL